MQRVPLHRGHYHLLIFTLRDIVKEPATLDYGPLYWRHALHKKTVRLLTCDLDKTRAEAGKWQNAWLDLQTELKDAKAEVTYTKAEHKDTKEKLREAEDKAKLEKIKHEGVVEFVKRDSLQEAARNVIGQLFLPTEQQSDEIKSVLTEDVKTKLVECFSRGKPMPAGLNYGAHQAESGAAHQAES
jgi:hypothetical protein